MWINLIEFINQTYFFLYYVINQCVTTFFHKNVYPKEDESKNLNYANLTNFQHNYRMTATTSRTLTFFSLIEKFRANTELAI